MRYRNSRTGTVVHTAEPKLLPGSDWVEATSAESGPARPAKSDSKDQWVAYVAATTDLSEAEAADMTKADLIDLAE